LASATLLKDLDERVESRGCPEREGSGVERGGEQGGWPMMLLSDESEEDVDDDPEEIINLKARRRYLKSSILTNLKDDDEMLQSRQQHPLALTFPSSQVIHMFDTNISLSSLSLLSSLIESHRCTVVIPLLSLPNLTVWHLRTATSHN
jgi:hypothetical protein